jgi:DNA-binding response OmpR family regulator
MITVLVVGDRDRAEELDAAAARNPSIELLHAADVEEALDRLARNRRIDAVLLLADLDSARGLAGILREEDPAGPPLFLPAVSGVLEGLEALPGTTPEELLQSIVSSLSS